MGNSDQGTTHTYTASRVDVSMSVNESAGNPNPPTPHVLLSKPPKPQRRDAHIFSECPFVHQARATYWCDRVAAPGSASTQSSRQNG